MTTTTNDDQDVIDLDDDSALSPRKIRLKTLDDVRVEMARVYRDMRGRKIETAEGTRLVYVLSQIGRVLELARIENRVDEMRLALERAGISYVPDA